MTIEAKGRDWQSGVSQKYFVVLCLVLVAVNVFTFLYHMSAAILFSALGNAAGIGLILYAIHAVLSAKDEGSGAAKYIVLAGIFAGLSLVANLPVASPVDTLKFLAIYVFYAAGRAWPGRPSATETNCIYTLAVLPFVFMLIGRSKVYPAESVFYLPNANTAVLYFSALLFALAPKLRSGALVLQFVNAAVMSKVGAAVATFAAITLWLVVPFRRGSMVAATIALTGFVVTGAVAYTLGATDRLVTAYTNVMLIVELEPATIAAMSYRELVELTGTTDLSAFFRIIHWANVWDLSTGQGIVTLLFGFGAGQTRYIAYAPLAPHNDYLRVLGEYGLFSFGVFIAFLLHVVRGIKLMQARVLFIVLLIYFFSENLLDNFTSMAIFFAYAGRMAIVERRIVRRKRVQVIDDDVSPAPA